MNFVSKKSASIVCSLIVSISLMADPELPSIKVPVMDKGPQLIDGLFADGQWEKAAKIEAFKSVDGNSEIKEQTECCILQDKDNLYVGLTCYFKDYQKTTSKFNEQPDNVFAGDSIEVFIDPGRTGNYVQIAINPSGKVSFIGRKADIKTGVQVLKDRYQVEIEIPFKAIPFSQKDIKNIWGINFCRTNRQTNEFSCWSPTLVGFHNSSRFGNVEGIQADVANIFKLQKAQEEGNLILATDHTFYDNQKYVKLKVKVGNVKSLKGYSINSKIFDDKGKVISEETTSPVFFSNLINPVIGSLKNGRYQLKVALSNSQGEIIEHGKTSFWKINQAQAPEKNVQVKNHVIYVNGKFFFPIAIHLWNLSWGEITKYAGDREKQLQILESRLKDLKEHGFNTVVSNVSFFRDEIMENEQAVMDSGSRWPAIDIKNAKNFKISLSDILELLRKYNFYLIASPPFLKKADCSDDQVEAWSQLVLKYRSSPEILCWMNGDEFDGYVDRNKKVYEMLKELDPYHPTFINVINAVFPNKNSGDIISTDPYPVPNAPLTAVSAHADRLMSAVGENPTQSFWLILQLYGSAQEKKRCPTPAEMRSMAYLALNHGVKGLDYFGYYPENERNSNGVPQSEETWRYMKELNSQIQALAPIYCFGEHISPITVSNPAIDAVALKYEKNLYLIAVNSTDKQINCTIKVPWTGARKGMVMLENREVSFEASELNDTFKGYQVNVYKF